MQVEIDVTSFYDWTLRHKSDVADGEVAIESHHGSEFRLVQVHKQEPSTTYINVPDVDIERMLEDHREGVKNARLGYQTEHEGGDDHGKAVTVAPSNKPLKSKSRLLADHLGTTVMPYHAPNTAIRKVRIVHSTLEPAEQKKLERYLNRTLVEDLDGEEE